MFSLKKHFNSFFIVALFAKEWTASVTAAFAIAMHSLFHGYKSCELKKNYDLSTLASIRQIEAKDI